MGKGKLNRLTDVFCRTVETDKAAGQKCFDGLGLFLWVRPKGKYWYFQYPSKITGKRETLYIGSYPNDFSLKAARTKRDEYRALIVQGVDPVQHKKDVELERVRAEKNLFRQIAMEWHAHRKPEWTPRHADSYRRLLEKYAFPAIGNMRVGDITAALAWEQLLKPVADNVSSDTAKRVFMAVNMVFDYAVRLQLIEHNPVHSLRKALPKHEVKHYPTITDSQELRPLLLALDAYRGMETTRAYVRICPYLFQRPGEVRQMRWCEVDFDNALWTIPAERMKKRRTHLVPLSRQVLAILERLKPFSGHFEHVFCNGRGKPLSNSCGTRVLTNLGYHGRFTLHSWRHCASTLLHEHGFNSAHIEMQLAHLDNNKTRGTYNQAEYLPQRQEMMQWWADYLDNLKNGQPETGAAALPPHSLPVAALQTA